MAPRKSKVSNLEKDLKRDVESGERSTGMRGGREQQEKYLNIFIICAYLALFGLLIYSAYLDYGELENINTGSGSNTLGVEGAMLVCSFLVILAVLVFFATLSAVRYFYGNFGKGDHITFFVFTALAFALSLLISIWSGVFLYADKGSPDGGAKEALEFTFWTTLTVLVMTAAFLLFYIFRPSYLME
jgi:hypothetical protein